MNKRLLYACCLIGACIIIFSRCITGAAKTEDLRGEQFAGATACITCHKNIYESFAATAHNNTSSPSTKAGIKGSFTAPDNTFFYSPAVKVVMEEKDGNLVQAAYDNNTLQQAHQFDITVGSGRKAQTYLYWKEGKYYQLPISYFVPTHSWANSPSFPATYPLYERPIPSTCFGCHSSTIVRKSVKMQGLTMDEEFEQGKVVYGIDCERCHGPAAKHVEFQTEHPQEKQAKYITTIKTLNNLQKLDMCGICHSGLRAPQKSAFDFRPGHALSDYFYADFGRASPVKQLDVHGNQYQLFMGSKCYIKSASSMNCSSCHNPHATERENLQLFNQRCMSCHNTDSHNTCTMTSLPQATLIKNCIDCHMPALPSGNITLLTNGQVNPVPDYIRTHLITVYPDETKKVVERVEQKRDMN